MSAGAKRPKAKAAASCSSTSTLSQHSLLEITWEDATFDLDREPTTDVMVTVGWLIKQTKHSITLAGECNAKLDYFRAYTCIPQGMIRRLRLLQPAAEAK